MDTLLLTVSPEHQGERLDRFIAAAAPDLTRSAVQRLCRDGFVEVDGVLASKNIRLRGGERVAVALPDPKPMEARPQAIPLTILYEDQDLVVVDKPKGMVVHPAAGNQEGTLVNGLLHHCAGQLSGIGGVVRPGIVHRLDKDTSGLLMAAKTDLAHRELSAQLKARTVTRRYLAVVYGRVREDAGRIDAPIGRHPADRKKMSVRAKQAREAATQYTVLERLEDFTYLELTLETGRTHQIRVHLASIGHPVAGDPVYGPKKTIADLGGQCLHARLLGFRHPRTGEYLEFSAEPPQSFLKFLNKCRGGSH